MATGRFSDSRLAETVGDDVLAGRFLWCEALGWLRWSGTLERRSRWLARKEDFKHERRRRSTSRRLWQRGFSERLRSR